MSIVHQRDACRTAARLGARPAPECHAAEQTSLAGSRITRARFGSEGGHRLFRSPALRKGGPQAALGRRKKAGIPRALSKRRMPAYKVRGRALLNALTYAEEDKGKRVAARKESRHPGIPPRRVSGPPKALDGAERPRPQWPNRPLPFWPAPRGTMVTIVFEFPCRHRRSVVTSSHFLSNA